MYAMASLHYITHAVTLAIIATLVRKYLQIKYAYDDLEERCGHHPEEGIPPYHDREEETNINTNSKSEKKISEFDGFSTSLWCLGRNRSDRICKFENLCYSTVNDDFVFVHGEGSVIEGVEPQAIHNELLDMSTVDGHNIHFLRMVDIPLKSLQDFSVYWFDVPTLLFSRFKPDNIMHVLHDDIFPLYHTLEMITLGTNQSKTPCDIQLIFFEGWDIGEFESVYSLFTSHDLKTKEQLSDAGELVCFRTGHIGISKTPTWYQYGFDRPQGPVDQSTASSQHIHRTVNYLLDVYSLDECQICGSGEYLVLVSRRENRLILNQMELSAAMSYETNMKVVVISFETHAVREMMKIVRHSRGIIGMHGSLLILAAFLKPGSVVLELFPFAIIPDNYTPFKSLAKIAGMNLIYRSWSNQNRDNTVMHPDWPAELGGIHDLTSEEQSYIMDQSEVPLHLCCEDPSWLFHIYQDTKVDIPAIKHLLADSLSEASKYEQEIQPLLQGPVKNVTCGVSKYNEVTLSWKCPWNIKYLNYQTVEYEIWLQNTESESTLSVIVGDVSSHVITAHVTPGVRYNVWIRCLLDNKTQGPFSDAINCHI